MKYKKDNTQIMYVKGLIFLSLPVKCIFRRFKMKFEKSSFI